MRLLLLLLLVWGFFYILTADCDLFHRVGEAVKPLEEVPPAKSLSNTSSPELTGSKQSDPKGICCAGILSFSLSLFFCW